MSKKVLIVYGTRFGSTEEVSQEIAKILEKEGIEPHLVNACKTREREWPSLENFEGILVGSGIRITQWTKEPKKFLENYKKEFEKREKVLGMFVCSALSLQDQAKAKKMYLEDIMEKIGVKADLYDAFGPVLDFSESSRIGFLDRKMLAAAVKGMAAETGITINEKARNDFRDWDQIRRFAEQFAALVKEKS